MNAAASAVPRCRTFEPVTSAIRAAREFVLAAPAAAGVDAGLLELALSEVASNAVLHAHTPFEVTVVPLEGGVRVEIADGDGHIPRAGSAGPSSITGRGLFIVASIVDRWAVEAVPDGKVVWFEMRAAVAS